MPSEPPAAFCSSSSRGYAPPYGGTKRSCRDRYLSKLLQLAIAIRQNVILTDTELSELKAELPDKWEYYIDRLSGYIASTGRKYKNHAATIRRWAADDTAKAAPKKGIPDYSYKEGESL